jgi:voltage-gated potassium channel
MGDPAAPAAPPATGGDERGLRLRHYEALAEPLLAVLGLDFLVLLIVDLANLPLTPVELTIVRASTPVIYGAFILDALIRFALTTHRLNWLRQNGLLLVALAAPLLLPFDKRLTTPLSVLSRLAVMLWGGLHGLSAIRTISRGKVFYYLVLLSTFVTLIGASVTLALERGHPGTPINSYGDALWWSATQMTTINSALDPVSPWGRVAAVALRIYAVGFFSYLTANLASLFVGYFKDRETHHQK